MTTRSRRLLTQISGLPVVSSGLSLASSTVVTAGLGFFFWILASRIYIDDDKFGVGATAITTMMMLADLACVGMRTGLVRFVPALGSLRQRIVGRAYLIAFAVAATVAAVFLLGLGLWAPGLAALTGTALTAVFFVVSTAFWSTFILEDSVLTGIRKTVWVPIENAVFGVAKIALLWPMSLVAPELGIFLAWALPVFPIVIVINILIARRLNAAEATATGVAQARYGQAAVGGDERSTTGRSLRALLSYSSADWLASVARLAATGIGPLLVLGFVGQAGAGYFSIGWLVAYTTFQLSVNVADAMLAESSFDLGDLNANSRQALLLSMGLTIPIVVVGLIGAPLILRIFGQSFADNASGLLRLLFVAAVPNVAYQIFLGRLRSLGRMRLVIAMEALLAVIVLGLGTLALPRMGLVGIGLAWLVALGGLGAAAVLVETQWWWASRLNTGLVRAIGGRMSWIRRPRVTADVEARLNQAMVELDLQPARAPVWTFRDQHLTRVQLDGRGVVHEVLLAVDDHGRAVLDESAAIIHALNGDKRLARLHGLLPRIGNHGDDEPSDLLVLTRPPGESAAAVLERAAGGDPTAPEHQAFLATLLAPLTTMHHATAAVRTPTADELDRWIEQPVAHLQRNGRATNTELELLIRSLHADLDRPLIISRVHGRLTAHNIIVDDGSVTAIRGWRHSTDGPPLVDEMTLRLTAASILRPEELGEVVREALVKSEPFLSSTHHSEFSDQTSPAGLSQRTAILLAWLLLVGQDQPSGAAVLPNLFWASRNIQPVLAAVSSVMEVK